MSSLQKVYLVDAKRTPMGKIAGKLASVRVDDLLALVLKDLASRLNFDPRLIDDVIAGCSNQAGEDNRNLARMSSLLAGLPMDVPATTINRLCGSGLDAVSFGLSKIACGLADCVIVGGAESMSRAPYVMSKPESAYDREQKLFDSSFGWRFENPRMKELFPLLGMGQTAEEIATMTGITREQQDKFAFDSHQKAARAYAQKQFSRELVPVTVTQKKDSFIVDQDECVRADTTLDQLAKLKAVFKKDGTVTAGNASPMNDGASACLLVSERFLKEHKLTPMLRLVATEVRGRHPSTMGLGPVDAIKKLQERQGLKLSSLDVLELNEAFAVQVLGCLHYLPEIDPAKVNLRGGAIALGHPLGNSGTRLLTTLSSLMQDNPKLKNGLAAMCIGVGQGIALQVENCR
jgi:acetyl-CoA acetyltransferase family protein